MLIHVNKKKITVNEIQLTANKMRKRKRAGIHIITIFSLKSFMCIKLHTILHKKKKLPVKGTQILQP